MRAIGEELWEIKQLFQVKDFWKAWKDSEDALPFQLEKKKRKFKLLLLPILLLVGF